MRCTRLAEKMFRMPLGRGLDEAEIAREIRNSKVTPIEEAGRQMVITINRAPSESGAGADACENLARRLQELSVSETEKGCDKPGNGG